MRRLTKAEKARARELWRAEDGACLRVCPSCEQEKAVRTEPYARFCEEHWSMLCFPETRVECRHCEVGWVITSPSKYKHPLPEAVDA